MQYHRARTLYGNTILMIAARMQRPKDQYMCVKMTDEANFVLSDGIKFLQPDFDISHRNDKTSILIPDAGCNGAL